MVVVVVMMSHKLFVILVILHLILVYQVATQTASMVTLNMHHHQDFMRYVLKD
jgi:hypothetical protein